MLVTPKKLSQAFSPSVDVTRGIIAWWPFNGDFNDTSGTANQGLPQKSGGFLPPFIPAMPGGAVDQSADKAGQTWVVETVKNYGNAASLLTFTLSARFKVTAANLTVGSQIIGLGASQDGSSGTADRLLYIGNDGKLYIEIFTGSVVQANSTGTYADGQWHTATFTCQDKVAIKLYADGILLATTSIAGASAYTGYTTSFWCIGRGGGGGGVNFNSGLFAGAYSDIRVYNRALQAGEINAIHNSYYLPWMEGEWETLFTTAVVAPSVDTPSSMNIIRVQPPGWRW